MGWINFSFAITPLLLAGFNASAYVFSDGVSSDPMVIDRSFENFSELIPDLEELECEPQCVGSPKCAEFKIIEQCLKDGAEHGCFWSCD